MRQMAGTTASGHAGTVGSGPTGEPPAPPGRTQRGTSSLPRVEASYQLIRRSRRLAGHLPPQWDRRARTLGKLLVNYRGARRATARRLVFRAAGSASTLLVAPFGDAQVLVDTSDEEIGPVVFSTGGYERDYMAAALGALTERTGRSVAGTTFVDVGANIGTSTIDALVHFGFGRAACFEPESHNHRLLRMNVLLNGLEDRVTTYLVALSDADGDATLRRAARNLGDHVVQVPGTETAETDHDTTTVPVRCRRFDTLVEDGELDLDTIGLVWVDTQGHDAFVLAGATTATEAGVPMVVEYAPRHLLATGSLERLEELIAADYMTVVDVHLLSHGRGAQAALPAKDVKTLRDRYRPPEHTDLLLLR